MCTLCSVTLLASATHNVQPSCSNKHTAHSSIIARNTHYKTTLDHWFVLLCPQRRPGRLVDTSSRITPTELKGGAVCCFCSSHYTFSLHKSSIRGQIRVCDCCGLLTPVGSDLYSGQSPTGIYSILCHFCGSTVSTVSEVNT